MNSVPLETKPIGRVDFAPTVLALGCWVFGGAQWGGQEDQDSIGAMQAAIDAGITHFDTARAYGGGRSEKLVGGFLKKTNRATFSFLLKPQNPESKVSGLGFAGMSSLEAYSVQSRIKRSLSWGALINRLQDTDRAVQ